MSLRHLKQLFNADEPAWKNRAEFALLVALAFYTRDDLGFAWPSRVRLAKLLKMDPRSITRLIREMERRGLIETIEVGRGRRPSRYRVALVSGDARVTCESSAVTAASPGGDPLGVSGDSDVTSEVTTESPDQYVPGSNQERSAAPAALVSESSEEEDRAARMALLDKTATVIGISRKAVA